MPTPHIAIFNIFINIIKGNWFNKLANGRLFIKPFLQLTSQFLKSPFISLPSLLLELINKLKPFCWEIVWILIEQFPPIISPIFKSPPNPMVTDKNLLQYLQIIHHTLHLQVMILFYYQEHIVYLMVSYLVLGIFRTLLMIMLMSLSSFLKALYCKYPICAILSTL